jgi:hypothetical protein
MTEIEYIKWCDCIDEYFMCCINDSYIKQEEEKEKEKDLINVIFLYDQSDEKIDHNINKIIFYDEYIKGYYDDYIDYDEYKREILLIYNKNNIKNIVTIINYIHKNKGLNLKINKKYMKWIPKEIWVFN